MDKSRVSAKLDWNRMLGFEQITEERDSIRDESARALGPKVGHKVGEKTGLKVGIKLGQKIGLRVEATATAGLSRGGITVVVSATKPHS